MKKITNIRKTENGFIVTYLNPYMIASDKEMVFFKIEEMLEFVYRFFEYPNGRVSFYIKIEEYDPA